MIVAWLCLLVPAACDEPAPIDSGGAPSTRPVATRPVSSQPVATTQAGLFSRRFDSAEEAALAALIDRRGMLGAAPADLGRSETLAQLARATRARMDLSSDGRDELCVDIGTWARTNGSFGTVNDRVGNRAWALLAGDGSWRVLATGYGATVEALPTSSEGWRDLRAVWRRSPDAGSMALHRFDGQRHRTAWSFPVAGLVGADPALTPAPVPDSVLADMLAPEREDAGFQEIRLVAGAALAGDLDRDGTQDLLVQVDRVNADGRLVRLAAPLGPGNTCLYTRRDGRWMPLVRGTNLGPLRLPPAIGPGGPGVIEWRIARRGRQDVLQWHHIHNGRVVRSGQRRRFARAEPRF